MLDNKFRRIGSGLQQLFMVLVLLSLYVPAHSAGTLIFAIDIIRHGERTPISVIPTAPYQWPDGLGELTPTGMNQEFKLGNNLRNMYVNQYRLLPAKYVAATMYVRSSDYNRTLMSAQALLFGLYPLGTGPALRNHLAPALPSYYEPIPIHTVSQSQDSLLVIDKNPMFMELVEKYVYSTDEWEEKSANYAAKLQRWSKVTGLEMTDISQIIPLADNLYIRYTMGISMPSGITAVDYKDITDLAQWVTVKIFASHEVATYASIDLRSAIIEYLHAAIKNEDSPLKYVLFSAHDSTLMALMGALHYPLKETPPYASDLKILLFKDNNNDADGYSVKLMFNNTTMLLPACKYGQCTFKQFLDDMSH